MKYKPIYSVILLLVMIAGAAKGVADDLMFHFHDTVFSNLNHQFWNPEISWENKNAYEEYGALVHTLFRTVLVGLTDGWHLMNSITITSWVLICVILMLDIYHDPKSWRVLRLEEKGWIDKLLSKPVCFFVLFRVFFAAGFYLTYELL